MPIQALLALVRKDLVLYFSNRRAMLVTLAAPIAIAAFFGSILGPSTNSERSRIPIAIIDLDRSETSTKLVAAMTGDATFDVQPLDATQAAAAVRRGKLRAVLSLPAASDGTHRVRCSAVARSRRSRSGTTPRRRSRSRSSKEC